MYPVLMTVLDLVPLEFLKMTVSPDLDVVLEEILNTEVTGEELVSHLV